MNSAIDSAAAADGLIIVDKPAGWTSHDVVARMRRTAKTRRVGHAGTLDPMATGVLVLGIGKATRLLGRISLTGKSYDATIRLGIATSTDDAQGETLYVTDVRRLAGERARIEAAIAGLTGQIFQRPSSVSAIKIDGQRAYKRVRAGEEVKLAERRAIVSEFKLCGVAAVHSAQGPVVDLDVTVSVSSGTYVRALARDLGDHLGVGGHLTALRRTRVGPYSLTDASTLEELETQLRVLNLADVSRAMFQSVDLETDDAKIISHGGRLAWPAGCDTERPVAIFGPDGAPLALAEYKDSQLAPVVVWTP